MAMAIVLTFLTLWCLVMYALTEPDLVDEFASVYALIFFLQTLDHFSGMSLDWPSEVRTLFSSVSLANFNLQLLSLDCYDGWGGLPRRLVLQFSLPLICLAIYGCLLLGYTSLLYLARLLPRPGGYRESPIAALVRLQRSARLAHALDRTMGAYQALLYVMYPMLLINVLVIFDCRPVDMVTGLSVLDTQPSIDCYGEEHAKLFPLAAAALLVYVIGIPLLLFGGLLKGAPVQLNKVVFKARYGFLYLRYEAAYWWYEIIPLMRRSAVPFFMVLMSRFTVVQAALMLLSLFFALFFQDYARPYESNTADHVEFGSMLITHFILLIGILFHAVQLEQLKWTEGECLEVMTDIGQAENLSTIDDEWGDRSVKCAQDQLSFNAANATYKALEVLLKWFPVLFVFLAMAASYSDLYAALEKWQNRHEEDEVADAKLGDLFRLSDKVLAPAVQKGAKDFLEKSTKTEQAYFMHLLMVLDHDYEDWLEQQAKGVQEMLTQTVDQLTTNLSHLFKILSAFVQIIFCLRSKQRTHITTNGPIEVTRSKAAAAMPEKTGAVSKSAKVVGMAAKVVGMKLGRKKDEDEKPSKPKRAESNATHKIADADAGDDLVEAYIKFAKSAADKERDESAKLAQPELRPAMMGPTRT
jgi:hypothetical protein